MMDLIHERQRSNDWFCLWVPFSEFFSVMPAAKRDDGKYGIVVDCGGICDQIMKTSVKFLFPCAVVKRYVKCQDFWRVPHFFRELEALKMAALFLVPCVLRLDPCPAGPGRFRGGRRVLSPRWTTTRFDFEGDRT